MGDRLVPISLSVLPVLPTPTSNGVCLVLLWCQSQKCPPFLAISTFSPSQWCPQKHGACKRPELQRAVPPLQGDASREVLLDCWYQPSPDCETLALAGRACVSLLQSGFGGRNEAHDVSRMWVGRRGVRDAEGGRQRRRLTVCAEKWKLREVLLVFL